MRSPVMGDARRPHLMPCPRCGEANGVSAIACWKCEAQLGSDALLAPQGLPHEAAAARGAAHALPGAEASKPVRHEGPHTLPPFLPVTSGPTANDDFFSPPVKRKRHDAVLVAFGLALVFVAALAWWAWPQSAADHNPLAPAANMAIRQPVASDAPAAAQQAPEDAAATARVAPAPSPASAEPSLAEARRAALAALGQDASDAPPPAQPEADVAVNAPPPVQAPCTPQIAALGLCVLAHN